MSKKYANIFFNSVFVPLENALVQYVIFLHHSFEFIHVNIFVFMSNLKHLLKDVKICRKSIFSFFLSKSCFLVLSNYWTFFCCLLAISNLLTFGLFLSGFIQPKLNLIDLKIFLSFISRRFNFVQLILLNCTEISRITNEYYYYNHGKNWVIYMFRWYKNFHESSNILSIASPLQLLIEHVQYYKINNGADT